MTEVPPDGWALVEIQNVPSMKPPHPCLHASICCQVVGERQHQPDVVAACCRHHIVQPLHLHVQHQVPTSTSTCNFVTFHAEHASTPYGVTTSTLQIKPKWGPWSPRLGQWHQVFYISAMLGTLMPYTVSHLIRPFDHLWLTQMSASEHPVSQCLHAGVPWLMKISHGNGSNERRWYEVLLHYMHGGRGRSPHLGPAHPGRRGLVVWRSTVVHPQTPKCAAL